jgi:NAD(P)H dehydrogenase (quinone)
MIVITGATGQLGSQIVERLLERHPADQIGVSVRDAARAQQLADRGVRVRQADFADQDSLATAFEGASQVLLVSASSTGPEALAQHHRAVDAARDAGARRILYTSHQGASADSAFAPMPDHLATEDYLSQSGTPFTALRNGFYASTVPRLVGAALETGELLAPVDGPVSWTNHADLAEAAAIILADEGRFEGPTPPLTASEAVDLDGVAGILTEITGRTIKRIVVDDDEFVAGLVGRSVPEFQAQMLLGMFLASRRGEFASVSPALGDLLGREPIAVRAVLEGVLSSR